MAMLGNMKAEWMRLSMVMSIPFGRTEASMAMFRIVT
jgi:hypothetical protein